MIDRFVDFDCCMDFKQVIAWTFIILHKDNWIACNLSSILQLWRTKLLSSFIQMRQIVPLCLSIRALINNAITNMEFHCYWIIVRCVSYRKALSEVLYSHRHSHSRCKAVFYQMYTPSIVLSSSCKYAMLVTTIRVILMTLYSTDTIFTATVNAATSSL